MLDRGGLECASVAFVGGARVVGLLCVHATRTQLPTVYRNGSAYPSPNGVHSATLHSLCSTPSSALLNSLRLLPFAVPFTTRTLLCKQGVTINNFATITWDGRILQGAKEQGKARPCFMLTESFAKGFGLPYKKFTRVQMAPLEEVNFTKIAIRYSNSLQKDDVSAGMRDIFRRLGQVLAQRRPVSVSFAFGKLVSRDSKVSFHFNPDMKVRRRPVSKQGLEQGEDAELTVEDIERWLGDGKFEGDMTRMLEQEAGSARGGPSAGPGRGGGSAGGRVEGDDGKAGGGGGPVPEQPERAGSVPLLDLGSMREAMEEAMHSAAAAEADAAAAAAAAAADGGLKGEYYRDEGDEGGAMSASGGGGYYDQEDGQENVAYGNDDAYLEAGEGTGAGLLFAVSGGASTLLSASNALNAHAVHETAYARHLKSVEDLLLLEEEEAWQRKQQHAEREREARGVRENKLAEVKRVQGYIKQQIRERNRVRRKEQNAEHAPGQHGAAPWDMPKAPRRAGDFGRLKEGASYTAKAQARMDAADEDGDGILTFEEAEQALKVEQLELCEFLSNQIATKRVLEKRSQNARLEEEKRFLRHVEDLSFKQREAKLKQTKQMREKMRVAWERDAHIKSLLKLRDERRRKGLSGVDGPERLSLVPDRRHSEEDRRQSEYRERRERAWLRRE